uniref:C-CAP/cofactor C-like domain-containing protein n=1 Tax=Mesocestoides corti TaxID=53468 RepID=A0A5K3EIX0_MESCO
MLHACLSGLRAIKRARFAVHCLIPPSSAQTSELFHVKTKSALQTARACLSCCNADFGAILLSIFIRAFRPTNLDMLDRIHTLSCFTFFELLCAHMHTPFTPITSCWPCANRECDSCKKTSLLFDTVISSVDIVNCASAQVQVTGFMPTINIDKTDGCQVYLSEESKGVDIITAKSSEMNILIPKDNGEFVEYPIPE